MTQAKPVPVISLREVTLDDARLLYLCATNPRTRNNSVNQEPITWETHIGWLVSRIDDMNAHSFIAHADCADIGTVSLDYRPTTLAKSLSCNAGMVNHARVSITVAPLHRGFGYATPMLKALCRRAKHSGVRTLEALVKRGNEPSLSAFRSCGFWVTHQEGQLWTLDDRR